MNFRLYVTLAVATALLAGCATRRPAPVVDRTRGDAPVTTVDPKQPPPALATPEEARKVHVVLKGETLIAVALQYGVDYRELAAWNNIENPNLIQVGQELRVVAPPAGATGIVATPIALPGAPVARPLDGPAAATAQPEVKSASGIKTEPKAIKLPYTDQALAELEADARKVAGTSNGIPVTPASPAPAVSAAKGDDDKVDWSWPVKGKVLAAYTETSKGIDIAGTLKTPVLAAADGKVMYSGTGIRGYGKLVILKHNSLFLSAYAHNNDIVVKEGQEVKKGQKIAEMGSSDTDQVKLHFEIRRQGKPVDPAKFLPAP